MNYNLMLLKSEDGQEYARAVLYPADWTAEHADELAIQAFTAAQAADPIEWSWEDYKPELERLGFVIPEWHDGPTWDRQR